MFFDQAFMGLPNFFLSNPEYNENHEYEASITQAFALSVFQELNARNLQNPQNYIRQEIRYKDAPDKIKGYHADFRMNLKKHKEIHGENIVTDELAKYGFCEDNWLEVKYFREGQNPTNNRRNLSEDIIRLILLTPFSDSVGRYFLHVYASKPSDFIASTTRGAPKKITQNVQVLDSHEEEEKPIRTWYEKLQSPGRKKIDFGKIDKTNTHFSDEILKIKISKLWVHNNIIKPRKQDELPYFLLTRIDHFEVEYKGNRIEYEYGAISGDIEAFESNLAELFEEKKTAGRSKK